MARVAALAPDLFFASKIEATLAAAGHEVTLASSSDELDPAAEIVIVDLDAVPPDEAPRAAPLLGFYSHVNAETKRRAEQAGFDLVVARSRMAREMPALVVHLLASE